MHEKCVTVAQGNSREFSTESQTFISIHVAVVLNHFIPEDSGFNGTPLTRRWIWQHELKTPGLISFDINIQKNPKNTVYLN